MHEDHINRIQEAVQDGRYRFSDHSLEEIDADRLHPINVETALLNGQVVRFQPDEPDHPGPRYTVTGKASDLSTDVTVVCRFDRTENLLIITAYIPSP
ncbi:MAG: DUF4258 domain-containing protein [Planctomycetes bacterium]|nr:DUF4258 domain-containing protein [Planctomycetota bacterium]